MKQGKFCARGKHYVFRLDVHVAQAPLMQGSKYGQQLACDPASISLNQGAAS